MSADDLLSTKVQEFDHVKADSEEILNSYYNFIVADMCAYRCDQN